MLLVWWKRKGIKERIRIPLEEDAVLCRDVRKLNYSVSVMLCSSLSRKVT